MTGIKKYFLLFTIIIWAMSLDACSDSGQDYTGGDTDIGGLFWDILHGVRGDEPAQKEQPVIINIRNDTDDEIIQMGITWAAAGNGPDSRELSHSDAAPLGKGEACVFMLYPDDFSSKVLNDLEISVNVKCAAGNEYSPCGQVSITSPVYGNTYFYSLCKEGDSFILLQIKDSGG